MYGMSHMINRCLMRLTAMKPYTAAMYHPPTTPHRTVRMPSKHVQDCSYFTFDCYGKLLD